MRFLPNALSIVRMALVAPVVWCIATHRYEVALGLFAVAGVSDALDGAIAKRYGWATVLGAFLDPAADKLLVLGSYTALAVDLQVPWWLLGLLFGRDLVIVGGAAVYRWRRGPFEIQPALTSKIATGLLIAIGLALVIQGAYPYLGASAKVALIVLLAVSLVVSGADYVLTWGLRFARLREPVRPELTAVPSAQAVQTMERKSATGPS
ncbi:MAG TPA: CDP-alcohol phosphatidyltransferase family protein [Gammaproteobacteria bacterium]|nr:CDP-alcohol phosphatidyltransferase family protein [Gammaproteobacteria bacterium]